ncbi:MAG: hypothetical protein KatS3mg025_1062 [Bacteroidia bacterium]|nr:MAG: hypothetical protein KatS3mg025_1062 [Bacteroidia bacterium]
MRTIAVVLSLALATAGLYAQKPTGGTITGEVALNGAINNISIGLVQGARVRYFLGDNLAIRVGLGLTAPSRTNKAYENPDGTGGVGEEKESYFGLQLLPGIEYHFAGGEKLSTFAGAYLDIGFSSAKTTRTNYAGGAYTANFSQTVDGQSSFGRKGSSFGLGLYSGFDWYFAEKLYLGVEWGLNFGITNQSDVVTETSVGGTTTKTVTAGGKGSGVIVNALGALRLGYQF